MRKNVLIYPGNGVNAICVFQCLKDSLRYRPILGNHGDAHGSYLTEDFFSNLPMITSSNFFAEMNKFIDDNNIEFLIPTHDTVAEFLEENIDKLPTKVVCSESYTSRICRHKRMTYELFADQDFVPKVYSPDDCEYPLFAKDDIGQGGKNSKIVLSYDELKELMSHKDIDYVLTEYLPGEEVTIDCFTDRYHNLLFSQMRIRATIMNGLSGHTILVNMPSQVRTMIDTINERLCFRGYWYIQCKKDKYGNYKLMEISTRFSGSFIVTCNLDVNFPLLALTDFDEIDVKIKPNQYHLEADRSYIIRYKTDIVFDRVYLDFDDTLVFNRKKYNIKTIAFLFDCINKNKEIYLITRHAYNIHETLKKTGLSEDLFTKIITIPDDASKSDYIDSTVPCILVDNSFKERLEVKTNLGIPTFDTINLDCLFQFS